MIEDIKLLEDRRFAAVLRSDVAALAPLLHADLRYIHSSGVVQNRDEYIQDIANKVWVYKEVQRSNESYSIFADVALVSNQLDMTVVFNGDVHAVHSTALSVWVRESHVWRLIAVQSTPVGPSQA